MKAAIITILSIAGVAFVLAFFGFLCELAERFRMMREFKRLRKRIDELDGWDSELFERRWT